MRERNAGPAAGRVDRMPSAGGRIARLAYARARVERIALEPLLRKAGLTRHQIEDPRARLNVRDQIRFLNLVAAALRDDLLGFHLAQIPDLREFDMLYYVPASSEVVIDAFERVARYSTLANEGITQRCIDGRHIGLSFRYKGVSRHLDQHQIEFWMTAIVRVCRKLTGLHVLPLRVRFVHHRRRKPGELAAFFGSDLVFGADADEIVFAKGLRRSPIVSADPYLNELLVSYCEEALSHRKRDRGSFRSSVENAVVPLLPHGKARTVEIARSLGLSQRTFARRLSREGVSFSGLLETLRSDLAEHYLADADLSISQVAWLLGYQEVGAFSHAFKRWTGKSPRQVRWDAS